MWSAALAAQVRRPATSRPTRRLASTAAPPSTTSVEGIGELGHRSRRHQDRRSSRNLGHRRARGGDEGCPARQRFEGGKPETLLVGRIGRHRGPPQERRHGVVGDVSGADDAVGGAGLVVWTARPPPPPSPVGRPGPRRARAGRWRPGRRRPPGRGPPSWARGCPRTGHREDAPRTARGTRRRRRARRRRHRPGVRIGLGPEAVVVDTVGHHEHPSRRRAQFAETIGGSTAHAHDGVGVAGRHPDGPTEHDDLAPLVPLGMVEEREVVNGHDAWQSRSARAWCSAARGARRRMRRRADRGAGSAPTSGGQADARATHGPYRRPGRRRAQVAPTRPSWRRHHNVNATSSRANRAVARSIV